MILSRRRKEPPIVTYAFSESVVAGPHAPWHISPVQDGELKLGGGAPAPLCDRGWFGGGWHLKAGLGEDGQLLPGWVGSDFVCLVCAANWAAQQGAVNHEEP